MKINEFPSQTTRHRVRVKNIEIGGPDFVVIAGPCSIESREQLSTTAQAVKKSGASMLRGGIWKMRTNPQSFQGLGNEAIDLIREVTAQTGLGMVAEITDPRQMDVLHQVVDAYQVGARNMYNYALLKELGHQKKPVLLKRGFSALVDEWLKAAEYITIGGNSNVILCERGIRTFETSTRYTFDLNSVLVAKAKGPFPVIVDPSHAVGMREFVPQLSLAAAAAGADGLIIEVHPIPETALSDGRQSMNLTSFDSLMKTLEKVLLAVDRPLARPQ